MFTENNWTQNSKHSTRSREPISEKKRLITTFRFFAAGGNTSFITTDTYDAIVNSLKCSSLSPPESGGRVVGKRCSI